MDNNESALVHLLSVAIGMSEIDNSKLEHINWDKIYNLSKEQGIYSMLYPVIKNLDLELKPGEGLLTNWKNITIFSSVYIKGNMDVIFEILNKFCQVGIQVLPLKGFVLREYYPLKDSRIMGDVDILIHKEDLQKSREILLEMGYKEEICSLKDIHFEHERYMPLELHFLLSESKRLVHADYLEKSIWENTETMLISHTEVIIPNTENQILHLCFHMLKHFIHSGIGLRQLCDLVLIIKVKGAEVNWSNFNNTIKKCEIDKFTISIFEVCRRLFNMDVPDVLYDKKLENDKYIDMIIENLLKGGVYKGIYGDSNLNVLGQQMIRMYEENENPKGVIKKTRYFLRVFFPQSESIKGKYNFLNKYPFLLPIAWVHRLVRGMFRRDRTLKEKKQLFTVNSKVLEERVELFNWLGI